MLKFPVIGFVRGKLILAMPTILLATLAAALADAPPRIFDHISVTASASWANDPIIEAASLLYGELGGRGVAWFLKGVAGQPGCEDVRCAARAISSLSLPPLQVRALGAALAARVEAPKVEAWAQLAAAVPGASPDRGALAHAAVWLCTCDGRIHVEVEDALAALAALVDSPEECREASASAVPAALDHAFDNDNAGGRRSADAVSTAPLLIAYVDPHAGAAMGAAMAALLAVPPATARIVLRYRPSAAVSPVPLQGFGAVVRLKASEYKVVDDRGVEAAADAADESDDDAVEGEPAGGDEAPSFLLRKRAGEPLVACMLIASLIASG